MIHKIELHFTYNYCIVHSHFLMSNSIFDYISWVSYVYVCLVVGIPTVGNDPTWKCVCTLSGYHDREIYDISWWALPTISVCSIRGFKCMQWISFCCTLARSLCNGFIATACADDCIRVFREVSTHMYTLTPLYNAHHHLVKGLCEGCKF